MKIERRSLLNTPFGLLGMCYLMRNISAAWCIDRHITVLKRNDGTYSFKNHNGPEISATVRDKIIKEIEK